MLKKCVICGKELVGRAAKVCSMEHRMQWCRSKQDERTRRHNDGLCGGFKRSTEWFIDMLGNKTRLHGDV